MRRAHRLLRLVQLLRARKVATAAELADELGVSTRTIYRAVRDLEDAGVPVEGEAGVGYRLGHRLDLPAMTFTPLELEALVLGARMVSAWADPELADAARTALERVRGALPSPLARAMDATFLFSTSSAWSRRAADHLGLLRQAIASQRVVRIAYTDGDGAVSEREIWPLGLYFWGTRWTVGAWCTLRQDFRTFRPDRITAVDVTNIRFETDDAHSLEAFLAAMRAQARPTATGEDRCSIPLS
jgi:predicted DNA-binding transcriptional regulator YafY